MLGRREGGGEWRAAGGAEPLMLRNAFRPSLRGARPRPTRRE